MKHILSSSFLALMVLSLNISCSDDEAIDDPVVNPERAVTILAVNDMHANIDNFPRFAYIVDSLRNLYPELILVSAGDNQTGHPANDQYDPRGLPIIELMNAVDFDLSAIGNHEFDTGQQGFAQLTQAADFDFMCSNIEAPNQYPFDIQASKMIRTNDGVKVGVASLLQLGANGIPDCYPAYTEGFTFHDPFKIAQKYTGMKDSCDVVIFVNHLGYTDDIALAKQLPSGSVDVIIGGHSHTKLDQEVVQNGILITQAENKLAYAALVNIVVNAEGKTESHMQLIPVGKDGNKDAKIEQMVNKYLDNPSMHKPIAKLTAPILRKDQLGYLMADALFDAAKVDFALVNAGGVRSSSWEMDVVTPYDVYTLDPFGNHVITISLSGAELHDFFVKGFYESKYHWIYPAGLIAEYKLAGDDLADVNLFTPDHKPLEKDKIYKVSMNNYMISAIDIPHKDKEVHLYIPTAENMISYLEKIKIVKSYQDEERVIVLK